MLIFGRPLDISMWSSFFVCLSEQRLPFSRMVKLTKHSMRDETERPLN